MEKRRVLGKVGFSVGRELLEKKQCKRPAGCCWIGSGPSELGSTQCGKELSEKKKRFPQKKKRRRNVLDVPLWTKKGKANML